MCRCWSAHESIVVTPKVTYMLASGCVQERCCLYCDCAFKKEKISMIHTTPVSSPTQGHQPLAFFTATQRRQRRAAPPLTPAPPRTHCPRRCRALKRPERTPWGCGPTSPSHQPVGGQRQIERVSRGERSRKAAAGHFSGPAASLVSTTARRRAGARGTTHWSWHGGIFSSCFSSHE